MPRITYFRLAYLSVCVIWLVYVGRMLAAPCTDCNPNRSAAVYCFLLIGVLPTAALYIGLFSLVPWYGRILTRS